MMVDSSDISSAGSDGQPGNSGTSVKTVPESDLVAMKQSLEAKIQESISALEVSKVENQRVADSLSQERVAREAAEAKIGELTPRLAELNELKPKFEILNTEHGKLKESQLVIRREALTARGVDSEKVKNLDEAAIIVLEANLPTIKSNGATKHGFDLNGSGSTTIEGRTARSLLEEAVKQA